MKSIKKFALLGTAFLMSFTLVSCSKNSKSDNFQTQSYIASSKPSVSKGENTWPTDYFITEEMKYTGTGDIVHTECINGKEDGDVDKSWNVFYRNAELDDVKTYIDSLKNNGFKYSGDEKKEPEVKFTNGAFSWSGKTDDEKHFISIYITDHNALTTAGDLENNIEQNMYIRLSNYDLSKTLEGDDDFSGDLISEISDNESEIK